MGTGDGHSRVRPFARTYDRRMWRVSRMAPGLGRSLWAIIKDRIGVGEAVICRCPSSVAARPPSRSLSGEEYPRTHAVGGSGQPAAEGCPPTFPNPGAFLRTRFLIPGQSSLLGHPSGALMHRVVAMREPFFQMRLTYPKYLVPWKVFKKFGQNSRFAVILEEFCVGRFIITIMKVACANDRVSF